jgi:hypothetical protein
MTSQRWGSLVSTLVFSLTLATAGSARAQFGFQGIPGSPAVGQFGPAYGAGIAYGVTPFDYGLVGCAGCGAYGAIDAFPNGGFGFAGGRRPQTTASYHSVSDVITAVPGWSGSPHRVRRRR